MPQARAEEPETIIHPSWSRGPSLACRLFSEDGTPLHNYASYMGVADIAAAAVRAGRVHRVEVDPAMGYAARALIRNSYVGGAALAIGHASVASCQW